jgi:hypothetical protein
MTDADAGLVPFDPPPVNIWWGDPRPPVTAGA